MYASEDLKNDKEIIISSVNQNQNDLYWGSKDLKNDRGGTLAAVF